MNGISIGVIVAVVAVIVVLGILMSGYVKASPDKAYIISGLKKGTQGTYWSCWY